jgi:hypothetical protein
MNNIENNIDIVVKKNIKEWDAANPSEPAKYNRCEVAGIVAKELEEIGISVQRKEIHKLFCNALDNNGL